jgi:ParB family chromosome partitioning protein
MAESILSPHVDLDLGDRPLAAPPFRSSQLAWGVSPAVSKELILLDPTTIIVPDTPNRSEDAFEGDAFDELRMSIAASGGNLEPILVQALASDPPQFELIFGERRLRACQLAKVPVLCMVSEPSTTTDQMLNRLRENLGRESLTPWDFGRQVRSLLDGPPPMKKIELAKAIGVSLALVSRADDLARLPEVVIEAFASPADLRYQDMKPLRDAWRAKSDAVAGEAERIHAEGIPLEAGKVVRRLVDAAKAAPVTDELAPCKQASKSPQPLTCGGERIGQWTVRPAGAIELVIDAPMSALDRDGLIGQVLVFVERKVLKKATSKSRKAVASSGPSTNSSTDVQLPGTEAQ